MQSSQVTTQAESGRWLALVLVLRSPDRRKKLENGIKDSKGRGPETPVKLVV